MSSRSPFNLPLPDGAPKFEGLVLKCQQEPSEIILRNPSLKQLEIAVSYVKAKVPQTVLLMLKQAVEEDTPIDKDLIKRAGSSSYAGIEERILTEWKNDKANSEREVIITNLTDEDELPQEGASQDGITPLHMELSLEKLSSGTVVARLRWEDQCSSKSLNTLISRWEVIDQVFVSLGKKPPPWDITRYQLKMTEDSDARFRFKDLWLNGHEADPDTILNYVEKPTPLSHRDFNQQSGVQADSFSLSGSAETEDLLKADHDDEIDEEEALDLLKPGDDIVIRNPSASQIVEIAKLGGLPLKGDVIEELLHNTRTHAHIEAEHFAPLPRQVRHRISTYYAHIYTLSEGFEEHTRIDIDEESRTSTNFCIAIFNEDSPIPGAENDIKVVFHWERWDTNAEIRNWEQIIDVARGQRG